MRLAVGLTAIGRNLAAAAAISLALWFTPAWAADEPLERVQVADPYLELRTGPGRGFPIYYVAERSEWIEIELRHTDWFKVRTAAGKEGWVVRQQLENTLTEAGSKKTFRDVVLDDYLKRRLEAGFAWGRFKSEPMLKVWTSYNLTDTLAVEATTGQVQGVFSGTDVWHVNLLMEPWSDWRLAPFLGIGFGKFKNIPQSTLISAITTNAKMADFTAGVRYHVTDRFVARADYTVYTAFIGDNRSDEYKAVTLGLSFFF
jgi:hypothetical protein